jgi:hypothetical protein
LAADTEHHKTDNQAPDKVVLEVRVEVLETTAEPDLDQHTHRVAQPQPDKDIQAVLAAARAAAAAPAAEVQGAWEATEQQQAQLAQAREAQEPLHIRRGWVSVVEHSGRSRRVVVAAQAAAAARALRRALIQVRGVVVLWAPPAASRKVPAARVGLDS